MLCYHCIQNADTLAKMDGVSEKDAPSLTSPALPLKRAQVERLPLHGSTPEIHLGTSLSKMGEVLRGRDEKRREGFLLPPNSAPAVLLSTG